MVISTKKIDERFSLKMNNDLKIINKVSKNQFRPILLALLRLFEDDNADYSLKKLENTISNLNKFLCRYNIVFRLTSNNLEKIVYEFSSKIHSENQIQSRKYIQSFWESLLGLVEEMADRSFVEAFSFIGYTKYKVELMGYVNSKSKCQILVEELELHYTNDIDKINKYTIEHIMDDQEGGIALSIGNLIPLTSQDNTTCIGKNFENKLEIYNNSNFETPKRFAQTYAEWDEEGIKRRTNEIARIFEMEIWNLQEKNYEK